MIKLINIVIILLGVINAFGQDYSEKYRPQYHFSPKKGWIGDPDGLVFHEGKYNLFWWGHAVSEDLVHWDELPYPLKGAPYKFSYFSGSVVVDRDNTSDFGKNSMIAIYTKHFPGDSLPETQAISVSRDGGMEFNYYDKNPVLDINKIFFRDPQVFWHEPSDMWKMIVSLPDVQELQIYESDNLKEWKYCSSFGNMGAKNSFWECPDLFELPVRGSNGEKKWVILIGRGPNRVQYFVGNFDGNQFFPDHKTSDFIKTGAGLNGSVFDDFEMNSYTKWQLEGKAFLTGSIPDDVRDYIGESCVSSFSEDETTGKMISTPFTINKNAINFLIGGGNKPDSLCIRLVVDGNELKTTTGDNTKVLKWNGWDVSNLIGKEAHLEIIDMDNGTSNASIAIDHIMFSDILMNTNLEHALWLDYGNDYYATRTWRSYDKNKNMGDSVFAIGWLGNWEYANKQPTTWGKGFHSVPRLMALKQTDVGYRIIQEPIPHLKQLRQSYYEKSSLFVDGKEVLDGFMPERNTYEMIVEFKPLSNAEFGLNLLVGEERKLVLSYNPVTSTICLDRTNCTDFVSDHEFTTSFATKMYAPLKINDELLRLHLFIDQASIEVFTNDGEVVLSATTFPSETQLGIEIFSNNGVTEVKSLKAWELSSIWNK